MIFDPVFTGANGPADQLRAGARACSRRSLSAASAFCPALRAGQKADVNLPARWRGAKRPCHYSF